MFTREDILMESLQRSEFAGVMVASDMVFENFLFEYVYGDEDTIYESEEGMLNTLTKMISSLIEKIKDFLKQKRDAFSAFVRKKKLDRLMSPEFRALLKEVKKFPNDKRFETMDMLQLKKISDAYTELIDKFASTMEQEMRKVSRLTSLDLYANSDWELGKQINQINQDLSRISTYIANVQYSVSKLEKQAKNVRTVMLTPEMIYKYVEAGIRSEDDIKKIQESVDRMKKKFLALADDIQKEFDDDMEVTKRVINKYSRDMAIKQEYLKEKERKRKQMNAMNKKKQKPFKESVEDEIMMESTKGGILSKIKGVFQKAISCVNEMVHSHAKVLSYVFGALSVISMVIGAANADGVASDIDTANAIKDGKLSDRVDIVGRDGKVRTYRGSEAIDVLKKSRNGHIARAIGFGELAAVSNLARLKLKKMQTEQENKNSMRDDKDIEDTLQ